MKSIIFLTTAMFFMFSTVLTAANKGDENKDDNNNTAAISGTVIDKASGENLAGVAIKVEGTDIVRYSDLDGNFTIKQLKPGSYNLVLSYISYSNSFVENITLKPGDSKNMNLHLIDETQ